MTMKKTPLIGGFLAAAILIGMFFVPEAAGLTGTGIRALGIMIALIVLLVTETFPIGVSCILGIALLVLFGVSPTVGAALSGYTSHVLFFVLVSFGISQAIVKVPLSRRLLRFLIHLFGYESKRILLAIMLCAGLVSSIMSNVATTAVFITIVEGILGAYDNGADRKKSGKAFMIGLPIAGMVGGIMTPAGSPINLLALDFLAQAGIQITFVQWMVIGIPIGIVGLLLSWFIISRVFCPAPLGAGRMATYLESLNIPKHFDAQERYVFILISGIFVLWVLSSWIPVLNITIVGIVGFTLLFLPGFSILTWGEFCSEVSWAAFFLIGTMMSMGNALTQSGVSDWLVGTVFPSSMAMPTPIILLVFSLIFFALLLPIPLGPVLISMLGGPLTALAISWGISPALLILALAICASCCFILPLDTVPLLTYVKGYYKMQEMPRASLPIQLSIAVCIALWVPIAIGILGLAG